MIKLLQGNCIKLMKKIKNKSVDLICTDIPYGVVNRKDNGLRNLDKSNADIVNFEIKDVIKEFVRICRGSIYIFCSTEQVSDIRKIMIEYGLTTRLCIWEKSNPSPMNGQYIWLSGVECIMYGKFKGATFNEHCKNTVFKYPCGRNKLHPTQKPVNLLEYLIKTSSNEGDLVMDPFMGSGSTGEACIKNNRNFIGMELDENYFKIAKKRIKNVKEKMKCIN